MTVIEVAEVLRTNRQFVYKVIKEGKLKALNVGSIKIRKEDLKSYLDIF